MHKSTQFPVFARRAICPARRAVVRYTGKFEFLYRHVAPDHPARRATSRSYPLTTCFNGAPRQTRMRDAQLPEEITVIP
ncbi:hypothetical protein A2U01_0070496, partial [Trifolium medium]|nr:hypothetical protein [Trifolium medium]